MENRRDSAVVLNNAERAELLALARGRTSMQSMAVRARIILACADGEPNKVVADQLGVWPQTVSKWRSRFLRLRVEGIRDAPRPGAPAKISSLGIQDIVTITLKRPPPNGGRWTTRALAQEMNLSQTTISRVWRSFGIHPDRHVTFSLSTDPAFLDKLRDIVGLYLDRNIKAVAFCLEESPVHLSGSAVRHGGRDPHRSGSNDVNAFLREVTRMRETVDAAARGGHARQFLDFLKTLVANVPSQVNVVLMIETGGAELGFAAMMWLTRNPRIKARFTPAIAVWFTELSHCAEVLDQKHRGVHLASLSELRHAIHRGHSPGAPPIVFAWVKCEDDLRVLLTKFNLAALNQSMAA